jgi:hypothetical protein
MKDLAKVNNNASIWVLLNASSCQVQYNCLNEVKCQVWCLLRNYLGYKTFHYVNAIVLNETQYDINYLRDLHCMIACSVFSFFYVCLESLRVDSMLATNLQTSQGNGSTMPSTFPIGLITLICWICFTM